MLWQRDMSNSNDALNELKRLQIALMAISADLDAVERVHHYYSLRSCDEEKSIDQEWPSPPAKSKCRACFRSRYE